jgi:hypothetical protein
LAYLTSSPNSQLPRFLAHTAADYRKPAPATLPIVVTTAPDTAAHRQLKPEQTRTTSSPKTPKKPTASPKPKTSPTEASTTVIDESTPVDQKDPLPDTKRTLYFLTQRTRAQQIEAICSNPHYVTSLDDWASSLDSDDLTDSQKKLAPYLPLIQELLELGYSHYQNLAQQVTQLRATNNQLKEDNNRLSTLPHKDPAFSHLQQDHQKLVETFNELNNAYQRTQQDLQEALNKQSFEFEDFQGKIKDWEQVGKSLLAQPYDPDTFQPSAEKAQQHAKDLVQALHAATQLRHKDQETNLELRKQLEKLRSHHRRLSDHITQTRMPDTEPSSSKAPMPSSGMFDEDLTPAQCRTIWNQIPKEYRSFPENVDHSTYPSTSVELMSALTLVGCNHPQEIRDDLLSGNPRYQSDDWEESRGLVRGLAAHRCPDASLFGINTSPTSGKLFKLSDVPKFTDSKEYPSFRSKLYRFLRTTQPPSVLEFPRALEIILSSFEDEAVAKATQTWDVTDLIADNWKHVKNSSRP